MQGRDRDANVDNGLVDMEWGEERVGRVERVALTWPCAQQAAGKLLQSKGGSAQCPVTAARGGVRGGGEAQDGEDIRILMAESCCCTAETNTTL